MICKYNGNMLDKIQEFFSEIPKPVLIGVALLVIVGAFFLWKKFSSKDNENEVEKGVYNAEHYAKGIQQGLDKETSPLLGGSTLSPGYAKEVQQGLQDLETEKPVVAAATNDEMLEGESDDDLDNYE